MRPIKFRAWDKKWKRWILPKDILVYGNGNADFDRSGDNGDIIETTELQHNEIILMQYTGLKDKNGKEIYEGDIVKFERTVNNLGGKETEILPVIWYKEESRWAYGEETAFYADSDCEVIGNIYENPERTEVSDERTN